MSQTPMEEALKLLEAKLNQLKLEYEQYFLGSRPREPVMLRRDVQKQIHRHTNDPIQNTALRFKFNGINSRFQAFKRQWDNILRQIEAGTYQRHVFKADLRERERGLHNEATATPTRSRGSAGSDLFEAYVGAAEACGQNVRDLTPEKLQKILTRQEAQIRDRFDCSRVNFRVVVQDGKVKLRASPVSD